jgi:cell wall-associated NlpC family hydrolase
VSDRIRLALLILVLVAFISARAGGALGATAHSRHTSARQARIVTYARHLLGIRYSYGGSSPRSGFDCSGFTRFVYGHFGIALPHYSVAQFSLGRRVARGSLKPGDLVFFDGLGHVGIYIGRGRFIHAPHTGTRVSVEPLSGWYSARFVGARRVI